MQIYVKRFNTCRTGNLAFPQHLKGECNFFGYTSKARVTLLLKRAVSTVHFPRTWLTIVAECAKDNHNLHFQQTIGNINSSDCVAFVARLIWWSFSICRLMLLGMTTNDRVFHYESTYSLSHRDNNKIDTRTCEHTTQQQPKRKTNDTKAATIQISKSRID